MRAVPWLVLTLYASSLPALAETAGLNITVDLSEQRMEVVREGETLADWPVSTAREGKVTPTGTYQPQAMTEMHFSTLYDGAPMPWSIFFHGNYAIHGTEQVEALGCPASAGCIRLHPDNARALFDWVKDAGMGDTVIKVVE